MKNKRNNGERLLSDMKFGKTGEEVCPGKDTELTGMECDSKTQKKMEQEKMLPEEMRFEAVTADIERATEFVNQYLDESGCPMKVQIQIAIVIDELFGNIVHYAYPQGSGSVWVRIETEKKTLTLTFRDCGTPYNPLARKDPDITLSLEEREPGGLGIYMVKKSMDALSYEYKDGQNILTVKKAW